MRESAKRAVIISAAPVDASMKAYLRQDDFVVACDAGYKNAAILGAEPNLLIGDFDSAPKPDSTADCIVLPCKKDDTDTHYAALWLIEHGYRDILLLGVLGGQRPEHSLANIATGLYLARQGASVCLVGQQCEMRYLLHGHEMQLCPKSENRTRPWHYFSVFTMDGRVQGLSIKNAVYLLDDAELVPDRPVGVSNEFVGGPVMLRCKAGDALVISTFADDAQTNN